MISVEFPYFQATTVIVHFSMIYSILNIMLEMEILWDQVSNGDHFVETTNNGYKTQIQDFLVDKWRSDELISLQGTCGIPAGSSNKLLNQWPAQKGISGKLRWVMGSEVTQ